MKNYSNPRFVLSEFSKSSIVDIKTFFLDVKVKETKKRVKFFDNTKIMAIDRNAMIFIFDLAQNLKVKCLNFLFFHLANLLLLLI